jgi:predicted DNA-binding transcriptional regulator YafY
VYDVEVLISVPAQTVRNLVGRWGTVVPTDEGQCRLTMRAESLDWPAMALGTLGAPFRVIQPPELSELLRSWSELFAAATEPSG